MCSVRSTELFGNGCSQVNHRHRFIFIQLYATCLNNFNDTLPNPTGWLMTVQAFYTLGFMGSFGTQIILAFIVTRWPLKFIISMEWLLTLICCIANGVTGKN